MNIIKKNNHMFFKSKLKKIYLNILITFLFIFLFLTLIIPKKYSSTSFEAIELWALKILPGAFPFLFISSLIKQKGGIKKISKLLYPITSFLFGISKNGSFCFYNSLISGYPIGISLFSTMEKDNILTKKDLFILPFICSTASPFFVIGGIGAGMFTNLKIGWILFLSHIIAVIIIGVIANIFFNLKYKKDKINTIDKTTTQPPITLNENIINCILSALIVGGNITIFHLLSTILEKFNLLSFPEKLISFIPFLKDCSKGLVKGLIETTGGCIYLSTIKSNYAISTCAFLITFGGISIIYQQIIYLKSSEIKILPFLIIKFLQGLISFLICFIIL